MAHPSVVINGVQYPNVPQVQIPEVGSGTATFYDNSECDAAAGDVLAGKKFIGLSGEGTGNIQSQAATTYTPSGVAQTIASGKYLSGVQTIEAVVCTNLSESNILRGVTVKVGTATDDDSVTSVSGNLSVPTVSQDGTTKILSIS